MKVAKRKAETTVVNLAKVYSVEIAPKYQPAAVEVRHEFTLPAAPEDGFSGAIIHGRIDREDKDTSIGDFKTSERKPRKDVHAKSLQFRMYSLLYELRHGKRPKRVIVDDLVDDGSRPYVVSTELHFGEDDYTAVLNQTMAVAKAVEKGVFIGSFGQFGAWWCAEGRCAFWYTCKFVPASLRRRK